MIILNLINKSKSFFFVRNDYFLYFIFFSLGFNRTIISFSLLLIYIIFNAEKIKTNIIFNKQFMILSLLFLGFLLSVFIIGYNRLTLIFPIKTLITLLIPILIGGVIFYYQKHEKKIILLGFYILGLFVESSVIITYSFLQNPEIYGHGNLISPFSSGEFNSPGFSGILGIVFGFYYYFAIYEKNALLKVLSILIVCLTLLGALFLGGRSFFFLVIFSIVFYFFVHLNLRNIIYFSLTLLFFTFLIYIFSENQYVAKYLDFMIDRFTSQGLHSGLNSGRFLLFEHGLKVILDYPFGGFSVDQSIERINWYLNIFLDSARVAGWIPVLCLLLALIYSLTVFLIKEKQKYDIFIFCVGINTFLVMQQEAILENIYKVLIVMFFVSCIMISSKEESNTAILK